MMTSLIGKRVRFPHHNNPFDGEIVALAYCADHFSAYFGFVALIRRADGTLENHQIANAEVIS